MQGGAAAATSRAVPSGTWLALALLTASLQALSPARALAADGIHWTFTGPTSVAFDWRGCDPTFRYGLSSAYGQVAIARRPSPMPYSSPGPYWEVELKGLRENTEYHYSIDLGPDHVFHTPPVPGSSGFSVYVQGDIGDSLTWARVAPVQTLIAAGDPDFVLCIGDLTYGNSNGLENVDSHFNDVMKWSQDAAYMPVWGNHEWESPGVDDLNDYKGRFVLPHPQPALGSPAPGCCDEDWSWFDYGNVRFISYPEPFAVRTWQDWQVHAMPIMDAAQADPTIRFIVTFGHQGAFSSGEHLGWGPLADLMAQLAAGHSKYVLNLNGHSHNYERSYPQSGVTHITSGTGGSPLEQEAGSCPWKGGCPPPSWSAFRAMHHVAVRLDFTDAAIRGTAYCGPAGDSGANKNDISCTSGTVIDSFTITAPSPPTRWIVDASHPSCSDLGPGTDAQPYCSISAAVLAHGGPGATVHVKPGSYREQVSVSASGSASAPFVLEAESGAVIDGADDYSSSGQWQVASGGAWQAVGVDWSPAQVLVDGLRLTAFAGSPSALPVNGFVWVASQGLYVNLGGGNPGLRVTRVSRRANGIAVSGSWVTVRDFTIRHTQAAAIASNGASHATISANSIDAPGTSGIAVNGGSSLTASANVVTHAINQGVVLSAGAAGSVLRANRSFANGGDGFLTLESTGTIHLGDVAFGNGGSGFRFAGSSGCQLWNAIGVDNGNAGSGFDLQVEAGSTSGFVSDYNLLWNSSAVAPFEYAGVPYSTLAAYAGASGQDTHSSAGDPRFVNSAGGDFRLLAGSPAIDSGNSGVSGFSDLDAEGYGRTDDPGVLNAGAGPTSFADRGALEFQPPAHFGALALSAPSGTEPLVVSLDGSGSLDPDGAFTAYMYDFGDGQTLSAQPQALVQHTYAAGTWLATVTAIDESGHMGVASGFIVVAPSASGPNLVGNPSFESGTTGWSSYGSTIQRVGGGFDGTWSLKATGPQTLVGFGINDSPNLVASATAATRYRYTAWVRSSGGGGTARIRVQEFYGGTAVAPRRESVPVKLSCLWQPVTLDVPAGLSGSTLDCQIVTVPNNLGETFFLDQISVRTVTGAVTDVPADSLGEAPLAPVLAPNPIVGGAILKFATTRPGPLRVDAYDIAGRRVRTWLDEPASAAGFHTIHVDAWAPGGRVGAGLYFYRIRAAEGVVTRRFLVVR